MAQKARHVDDFDLQILLMERTKGLHDYARRRIPAALQSIISPEDVLQEVWCAAFRGISSFRPNGADAIDRWLARITQRKLVAAIRGARALKRGGRNPPVRGVEQRRTSFLDLFARVAAKQRTPSSEDAAKEAVSAIQIALATLPGSYRRAMTMYHIDGRTRAEIAEALQKSDPAINSLLHRGLRMLRKELGPEGNFFSDDGNHQSRRLRGPDRVSY